MEYRKLISFGKSSFVVSIPKPWINKQKLKKGDILYFVENDTNLILSPQEKEIEEEKEISIKVDGKSIGQIQRELIPAYINNCKTIKLSGKEVKDKAEKIERIIQNLIALEIMEQTSDRIVAKDFLNFRDISVNNLIRKMDIITRAMLEDCINMFKEDTYENINHRDKDVNRISYLVYRIINYSLENQSKMIKLTKLTPKEMVGHHLLTYHIEAIADDVRRIARYMHEVKLSKEKQKEFVDYLNRAKSNYLETMKSFYNKDILLAHEVAERKKELINDIDKFYVNNRKIDWTGYLTNHFKRLVANIHKMGRVVYE